MAYFGRRWLAACITGRETIDILGDRGTVIGCFLRGPPPSPAWISFVEIMQGVRAFTVAALDFPNRKNLSTSASTRLQLPWDGHLG